MENFFDRLGELFRGLFSEGDEGETDGETPRSGARAGARDPDLEEAWKELDEYLRTGRDAPRTAGARGRARPSRAPDESLRTDYANLEVPFGADIDEVKRSYKSLVLRYHPDRFAADPEKQRVALEITKKINQSFERIRTNS
jgi:DnaJ-domain-containing protein 1